MKWHTFLMSAAAVERCSFVTKPHLSHAVDLDTMKPLCRFVKLTSLCVDTSLCKAGELPECPACQQAIAKAFTYTVWWFETDKFNGQQTRHWRDFTNGDDASAFASGMRLASPRGAYFDKIENCPWHHSHAAIKQPTKRKQ